jgi:hypothetical protein
MCAQNSKHAITSTCAHTRTTYDATTHTQPCARTCCMIVSPTHLSAGSGPPPSILRRRRPCKCNEEETKTEDKHRHDESSHAGRPPTMQLTPHRSENSVSQRPAAAWTIHTVQPCFWICAGQLSRSAASHSCSPVRSAALPFPLHQ